MEGYDFDAAAATIKIEDITTDECNQDILRRLKENDPDFYQLGLCGTCVDDYFPEDTNEVIWLGYFIGRNTTLKELTLSNSFQDFRNNTIESFCRGLNSNRSIQEISLYEMGLSGGELFQSLRPFFENNNNISELLVSGCEFGTGSARQLSLLLRGCNKSLKQVLISRNEMEDEKLVDVIDSLGAHPQLEKLEFPRMSIGRIECRALADFLRNTTINLQELNLCHNDIDDECVDALLGGLLTNASLSILNLRHNRIVSRGCQSLAALLVNPSCSLEELYLNSNRIGDEGALIFANAMASNRKLKTLNLYGTVIIPAKEWSSFSKVLCDTSSVTNTYLSNHTLESLDMRSNLPADVRALLTLNRSSEDKNKVAMKKILKHHRHFDMKPFFEWELKVLPIVVKLFERAQSIENNEEIGVGRHKLGAIYQFIHAMPEVFEPAPVAAGGEKRKRSAAHGLLE